jgi:hypothetical protein
VTTLPTAPPPMRTLDVAEYQVTEQGGIPHGQVLLRCRRPDCPSVYVLGSNRSIQVLGQDAYAAGWRPHPSLGPVCHLHPYGTPVAALEADEEALERSRQASVTTGEWPIPLREAS